MRVYVDASVGLRILFREPKPLPAWGQWTEAYSSRLWLTEALRTLHRARLMGAVNDADVVQFRQEAQIMHGAFHIVSVTERILARAGDTFPTVLGTLDAIHLATAMQVRDAVGLDAFFTHDAQLAAAAAASGFAVHGA